MPREALAEPPARFRVTLRQACHYVRRHDAPFAPDPRRFAVRRLPRNRGGYRFARLDALELIGRPAPYLIASANTRGDTGFAGAGLSWKIGKGPLYLRPGIGLVVQDGPRLRVGGDGRRTDLGSRILFEPEIALGTKLSDKVSIEASWTHISHARLFNRQQNPGIDMMGVRLVFALR